MWFGATTSVVLREQSNDITKLNKTTFKGFRRPQQLYIKLLALQKALLS